MCAKILKGKPAPKPAAPAPGGPVPIPYPNLLAAAKTGAPVIGSLPQLLDTLRATMPNGPLASMPTHYKQALNATGIPTPTGKAAQQQQAMIVQLQETQNKDSLGELSEDQQLKMQQAMDRLSKMMQMISNVQKKQSDTAQAIIGNLR